MDYLLDRNFLHVVYSMNFVSALHKAREGDFYVLCYSGFWLLLWTDHRADFRCVQLLMVSLGPRNTWTPGARNMNGTVGVLEWLPIPMVCPFLLFRLVLPLHCLNWFCFYFVVFNVTHHNVAWLIFYLIPILCIPPAKTTISSYIHL